MARGQTSAILLARLLPVLAMTLAVVVPVLTSCHRKCDCLLTSEGILVNCSARNLTSFPTFSSNISEMVLELDLSHNALWTLPGAAPKMPLLRALSMAANELASLPARWLRRLPALLRLDLSSNAQLSLGALGDGALLHAPVLQLLNLSGCAYADLNSAERVLRSFSLEVLDLSRCQLPEATGSLMAGLPALRQLDLSFNPLHVLQGLNSSTLQQLRLVRTGLDSIHPAAIIDLRALAELDVSGNRGFAFPERGVISVSLTVLRARFCEVRLHNLKAFPNLRYANLQYNSIQGVWNTSFSNEYLTELDLSNNNIHRIHPEAFHALPKLERLNLANNKIAQLHPDVFIENEFLVEVNLSTNMISDMGQMQSRSLATLDLSQCNVGTMTEDSLFGMPALRFLDLSSNRLERLPDNVTSDTLQWLDLSYCRLISVNNDTFRLLPALLVLDLAGNRFTEPFDAHAFSANQRLRALRLRDNPWRCDCASAAFQRFAEFTLTVDKSEATENARCASPAALAEQSWLQACYDAWYPPLDERGPVRRFGVAMLAVVAVAGGALVLLSAVRGAFRRRRKEGERRRQEEMERRLEERERELREQIRLELDDDVDSVYRGPRSRPHRSPSEITQPPTYEEALLLSRSMQDLLGGPGDGRGAGSGDGDAASPDSAAASATSARHVMYDVEMEPAPLPKPRPAKPPRKSTKWASGDVLETSRANVEGGLEMRAGASGGMSRYRHSAPGGGSFNHGTPDLGGNAEDSVGAIASIVADVVAEIGGMAGAVAGAASVSEANLPAPPSSATSAESTPRPLRPRSRYSSDASGEESDDPPAPR